VKVLILHQHFNTPRQGGAIRSYYLAKALLDMHIQPVVITGHNEAAYKYDNVEGIEVHYLPIAYHNRFGFWKRSLSFIRYVLGVARLARKMTDVKVCYAISVPLTIGLAALWLKARYKINYIFEVGDLWPEAPIQMGFVKNFFFKQALYKLEKFIYSKAMSVVTLSPMIKASVQKNAPGRPIYLLPNMADTDFYKPKPKRPQLLEKFGVEEGKFVVSYIGAVGLANGLDYFIECARASQLAGQSVHFLLCGDGALLDYFQRIVKQYQLKNFSFIPFQNRDGVSEVMNITDAVFICYKPLPVLETGSPNKYFDGLAAGKLIVINFGGWIKNEIEKHHCGIQVDAKYPIDFVTKIQPFISDTILLERYQNQSRLLAENEYSRKILSERFVRIFKGALAATDHPRLARRRASKL
jgi:glycosyltransferase involved in cell wall biosynthesis